MNNRLSGEVLPVVKVLEELEDKLVTKSARTRAFGDPTTLRYHTAPIGLGVDLGHLSPLAHGPILVKSTLSYFYT